MKNIFVHALLMFVAVTTAAPRVEQVTDESRAVSKRDPNPLIEKRWNCVRCNFAICPEGHDCCRCAGCSSTIC
ncbi:hypothetical protein TI39_contig4617g00001 [Zymoseptoria brevis]|uniref:Uncharacterized protein n=1 Tax=Zymoseptoria brevis TaxID=1047168 RepID=A0A0F4G6B0_9PEZI|nr:hypothetical protein TI39_contig4617g00001 [Zymoseptoria brevis]